MCRHRGVPFTRWNRIRVLLSLQLLPLVLTVLEEDGCAAAGNDEPVDRSSDPDGEGAGCGCGALKRSDFSPGDSASPRDQATTELRRDWNGENEEDADVIYLDGGEFVMGIVPADENDPSVSALDEEGPPRRETISPFGLGRYEVSNRRFARFVQETGWVTESETFGWSFGVEAFISAEVSASITQEVAQAPWWLPVQGADWRHPNGADTSISAMLDHPVTQVSLADAQAFCRWSRPGGRLPSEAEWEFAARGGKRRRRFPWGHGMLTGKTGGRHRMNVWQSVLDEKLVRGERVKNLYKYGDKSTGLVKEFYSTTNTALDGYNQTAPVDAYGPQNAFGFYNMVGNVWEWTSTPWANGTSEAGANPMGASPMGADPTGANPVGAKPMVKKGGSFLCHPATCNRFRCSARMVFTADSAASNVGFRCAYPKEAVAP